MHVPADVKELLTELYKDIDIHNDLDWDVTLAGNDTNACEAMNVMNGIFNALGIDKPSYTKEERDNVIKNSGEDPDDY